MIDFEILVKTRMGIIGPSITHSLTTPQPHESMRGEGTTQIPFHPNQMANMKETQRARFVHKYNWQTLISSGGPNSHSNLTHQHIIPLPNKPCPDKPPPL